MRFNKGQSSDPDDPKNYQIQCSDRVYKHWYELFRMTEGFQTLNRYVTYVHMISHTVICRLGVGIGIPIRVRLGYIRVLDFWGQIFYVHLGISKLRFGFGLDLCGFE